MADQHEHSFATAFLNTLSTQPITFNDDYQAPIDFHLKRVPVLQTPVPPPPPPGASRSSSHVEASPGGIQIVLKSIKPPASYPLLVHPTDTIASIKSQLATAHKPSAPPPDAQRLLLKGKALADNKLLKEYNVKEGDIITLVVKPGVEWDPTNTKAATSMDQSLAPAASGKPRHRHQRIPSVVLSPSPSTSTTDLLAGVDGTPGEAEKDILLTLDATEVPKPLHPETFTTYHDTVADPQYWARLLAFVRSEFTSESDALNAFEVYLCSTKSSLTPNEIAKIRDHTGVVGMAGT